MFENASSKSLSNLRPLLQKHLRISFTKSPRTKIPKEQLVFGHSFSDHMLKVDWEDGIGWGAPQIKPFGPIELLPSSSVLNYSTSCFEGLKAYKDDEGYIRLFRPELNMQRFVNSARRLALPDFCGKELLGCIKELLKVDATWIPEGKGYSLYIRPLLIGTQDSLGIAKSKKASLYVIGSPVGPYYSRVGFAAVSLKAEEEYIRAWPGGAGEHKISSNYAPGILPQELAHKEGCDQVLWLFGPSQYITEVGSMNAFVYWKSLHNPNKRQLVTPPLDGTILPGVTRDSILNLCRQWGEFDVLEAPITIHELLSALAEKRVLEVFGSGTAAIITPVKNVRFRNVDHAIPVDPNNPNDGAGPLAKRLWNELVKIQYGKVAHEWSVLVD